MSGYVKDNRTKISHLLRSIEEGEKLYFAIDITCGSDKERKFMYAEFTCASDLASSFEKGVDIYRIDEQSNTTIVIS